MSPEQAKALLKNRGWDVQSLARRWRLSRTWVSLKINDPAREPHWNDALAGLPVRSSLPLDDQHRTRRRAVRRPCRRWLPKGRFLDGYVEIGSHVVVERELGVDAPEGMDGLVVAIEDATSRRVRIAFASGYVDWFASESFLHQLHLTGRTLPGMQHYRAGSDADVQRDLRSGRLHFRFPD